MNSFETFTQLHKGNTPFLLGNIWDVNSAKIFEDKGLPAIGTSSQAVAKSFGYEDGENLPFETLFQLAKRVVEIVRIPFSVDLEGGYDRKVTGIIDNINRLHAVGVVGINLEDTIAGTNRTFQTVTEFCKTLDAVSDYISRNHLNVFVNVRTDAFLLGMADALEETLKRISKYQTSGANGIFVPCITREADIQEVVNGTKLPVNVMCMPGLPDFSVLQSVGVKRISMGPFVNMYANKITENVVETVIHENNFSSLFK